MKKYLIKSVKGVTVILVFQFIVLVSAIVFYSCTKLNENPDRILQQKEVAKLNKSIDYLSYDYIGLVNTNNVDIGFIGINIINNTLEVNILQSPNVCRMSILSLIDSSIYFIQNIVTETQNVKFTNVNYAHTFKLKQIIKDIIEEDSNYITTGEKILEIDMSKIALKNIILEKI